VDSQRRFKPLRHDTAGISNLQIAKRVVRARIARRTVTFCLAAPWPGIGPNGPGHALHADNDQAYDLRHDTAGISNLQIAKRVVRARIAVINTLEDRTIAGS
jgi:hypothetical protein